MPERWSRDDERMMQRALRLARRGSGRTRPNPVVGAVLARGGEVVGEGWHHAAGLPHAEIEAIRQAGGRARGATLYVTLEPCAHRGRTPPCTTALLDAGVRRTVVAIRDPHPIVDGRGLATLRRRGMRVDLGLRAEEAREVLGGYWHRHELGRPRVTWKVAATLDGRIADARGRSRWITGTAARRRGHVMRARSDAIVIGARTARRDDPRLTVRHGALRARGPDPAAERNGVPRGRQPLRVVCDTRLALPLTLRLFRRPLARGTVVACGRGAPVARERALAERGVTVWRLPTARGGVSPRGLARRLASTGCDDVLLEGGALLGTAWLREGLVDRIAVFTAPRLLGADALAWCGALHAPLDRAPHGRLESCTRVGDDALLVVRLTA